MDSAEQHAALLRATGGGPPHRVPADSPSAERLMPPPVLVVPQELPRELVEELTRQWEAALKDPEAGAVVRVPVGAEVVYPAQDMGGVASELVKALADIEDDEGRPVWMTAGEVELDQWLARVTSARDALAGHLAPPEEA